MHIFANSEDPNLIIAMFGKEKDNLQGQKHDIWKLYSATPI